MKKRKILINGETIILELRICNAGKCDKHFWVTVDSKQSICCGKCPEVTYGRPMLKGHMPEIRYPGQKRSKAEPPKAQGNFARRIIDLSWKQAQAAKAAKTLSEKQNRKESLKPSLHQRVQQAL